jgi:hypothetical protein
MMSRAAALVAEIIDRIEDRSHGTGRPPLPTLKIVEALRFFVREGVQWRELRATAGRACGSTLRRRLDEWHATAVLRRVHVALVRMVRSGPKAAPRDVVPRDVVPRDVVPRDVVPRDVVPRDVVPRDVVVDSCSVRAKRGGELTGPNPPPTAARLGPSTT